MDNDGGITDSDTSSYTSSDTKSDASSNDIVPTLQPGFALHLSTVRSVADNEIKGKRNVRSDKSKEFPNPSPGFPLRVPIVGSSVDYEGKGKKLLELTSDQTI
ncbi:hypothetical protein Tco_0959260 [Tanacetum coccineum]